MKVKLWDNMLFRSYLAVVSGISTVFSFVLIFFNIPENAKINVFIASLILFVLTYLTMWIYANKLTHRTISINGTTVEIIVGDIFQQKGSLKVIPFNEYFDTQVDDQIISSKTLNGQYIKQHLNESPEFLRKQIHDDERLKRVISYADAKKNPITRIKYPLGTIYKRDDYLLLAFSKFDAENRAYLDSKTFWACLINMWNEIDILHAGNSVCLPLLGTGITRMNNMALSEQEILELIVTSLKVSGLKMNWNIKLRIVIHESNRDSINFYSLRALSD